ncbi:TWiK family of potassium channels protein 18-like isoform X1 [Cimex lectularius]|uniref:Potassium channel domain-containing protein n=2 Tax=Cimex lectularius TaxID=79782 RepID=A0A8I6RBB8_CIMLE|nr:TWiK family of potassium channels protein 18-like isoform X1 [Cimex lectularius]
MPKKHQIRRRSSSSSSISDSPERPKKAPKPAASASGFNTILRELLPAPLADKIIDNLPSTFGVISKKLGTHVFFLLSIIIYDMVGALLYSLIEGGQEAEQVNDILSHRKITMDKIFELVKTGSPSLSKQSEELIKAYEKVIVENYDKNSKLLIRGEDELNWSFWGAAFFCGTVFTLIGSAHIKPLTVPGRALTIFYALIGIPLFLTLLADFGKLLTRLIKIVWIYVQNIYNTGSFKPPKGITGKADDDDDDDEDDEDDELQFDNIDRIMHIQRTPEDFSLPISLALSVFIMYIFFGAILYYLWEEWTFMESFYFVFISMATIGFGDFIPSTYFHMNSLIVYLTIGLAITSMCINVVQEKIAETFSHASAKLGETVGIEFADEPEKDENEVYEASDLFRAAAAASAGRGGMTLPARGRMSIAGRGGMPMPGRGRMSIAGRPTRGFPPEPGSSSAPPQNFNRY